MPLYDSRPHPQYGDGTAPLQVQPGTYEQVLEEMGASAQPVDEQEFVRRQQFAVLVGDTWGWGALVRYEEIEHQGKPHARVEYEHKGRRLYRLSRYGIVPGVVSE